MGLRPRQRFGDLGWASFPGDHRQVRNPHENLKVRPDNVEVRRAVIIAYIRTLTEPKRCNVGINACQST